ASFHAKFNEDSKAAFGAILFNDKNGFHSQKGIQGTYAYHLDLENENVFNQLSFGLSLSAVANEVNQTTFAGDPAVNQVIEKLSPIYRTIITLYHKKELSYKEIGEITDLPEGTLKNYLYRARKQLKENLLRNYRKEDL
ncbi:sigma-70 family RNA polymerase sigma factor, partial [Tenacibaculum sp.]|nr:sigma-70 family RNA polymerase sigma factor [Tenacibaculum sp.]